MPEPQVIRIEGDGIGPEVMSAAVKVLEAAGARIDWQRVQAGQEAYREHGTPLPAETVERLQQVRVLYKGPLTTPPEYQSPNGALRRLLGTYANVRRATYFHPGGRSHYPGLDLTMVRDLHEDISRGAGQIVGDDEAGIGIKVLTRKGSERVARFAYKWARDHGLNQVTIGHHGDIQRSTDGLFLRYAKDVARLEFPELAVHDEGFDALLMHLVIDPSPYQVLLTPNLYGGFLSGFCAGLTGSVGLVPGAAFGDDCAMFEPAHGSAPAHVGGNRVNPTAAILSGAMLLDYLGQQEAAERVRTAVTDTIAENRSVTYDLGGQASTTEMAEAICATLR